MAGGGFDLDLVIVGGGPAGATTALHLVRREGSSPSRILVVDKARFPRDKPCAGAVSSHGVRLLAELGLPLGVPHVPMTGARVRFADAVGTSHLAMGVVTRRVELDAWLLGCARGDGVQVRDGDGVTALARVTGGFRVTTASGEVVTTRLVAACDGAGSGVRKLLGLREPERRGHLYVLETPVGAADDGVARGLVDFDLSVLEDGVDGYYWDFPTLDGGAAAVSRGIYHANLRPQRDVKESFARALAKRGLDLSQLRPRPFSTRPFVAGSVTWVPGVVLVGEAAGIDRTTGEGIAQAIDMARIAARHLARALRTGSDRFEGYDADVRRSTTGRHLLQSAWLARRVYAPIGAPARRYLLGSDYARRAALRWYRGESLPALTKLRMAAGLGRAALG